MTTPLSRRTFLGSAAAPAILRSQARRRPNILFAIMDDWGFGHAGAYGSKWVKTPGFDRIAERGVTFNNTFTSNPKCAPCRASILAGRNSWQMKEAVNHFGIFPPDFLVYPDLLEKAGYFVGLTGKGWGPGDFQSTGWKRNPAGPLFNRATTKPPGLYMSNNDYAGNFADFLDKRPKDQPFCFWLGGHEPHRPYEDGIGLRLGKRLEDVTVPKYYPDHRIVRSDLLDYSVEVEYFDSHVLRALNYLEKTGEIDNTLVLMTSDHGMPFPRVKGQIYEDGFRVPCAAMWGREFKGGMRVDDFINVRDYAPTFLEAAGVEPAGTMTGKSFLDVMRAGRSGWVDESRSTMLTGKERHDLGRPRDAGYPVRAIRTKEFFYVRNYAPESWPAGNPETGYRNVDDSPTKSLILSRFDEYYRMSFGMRPAEELYLTSDGRENINNVAADPKYAEIKRKLRERMEELLRSEGDPRMLGRSDFFDTIEYVGQRKHSYEEWLKNSGVQK
ncbi:MAG: sulfatase [Bryobacteraceae bacterium]|nr:sulfatase [Bryobacteraceae bacterium]